MSTRSASTSRTRNASPSNSGLNLSRAQEKEQLETLNNRLAVYIDTVRRLEQDNKELKVKIVFFSNKNSNVLIFIKSVIASYSDSYEVESSKVKQLYEHELEDAKKLIEELARDKSRLEIEAEKADGEAQDALAK
jgi:sugar-specific transcriptional regulator TrmB